MTKIIVRCVRHGAVWVWIVFAAAVLVSAACTDSTTPKITEQLDDTLEDSTKLAG